ncbi:MAG: PspA/IM30 family protein [Myxococcota bacterium]
MSKHNGFVGRLIGLLRGSASAFLREREEQSPRAVYERAIQERVRQYKELKEAVAGILFMRNKLEAEVGERRGELARTHEDIRRAVLRSDDTVGLTLIQHKQLLLGETERAEREWTALQREAEEAKGNLLRFREEIRALERERGRTLATLANARARRRLREAFDGLSVEADMQALESVRAHVAHMVSEGELERELGVSDDVAQRIRGLRADAEQEAARQELEALKQELRPRTLAARAVTAAPAPAGASR